MTYLWKDIPVGTLFILGDNAIILVDKKEAIEKGGQRVFFQTYLSNNEVSENLSYCEYLTTDWFVYFPGE